MCIIDDLSFNPLNNPLGSVFLGPFSGWENSGLKGEKFTQHHLTGKWQSQDSPVAHKNFYKQIVSYSSPEKNQRNKAHNEKEWKREKCNKFTVNLINHYCLSLSPSLAHPQGLPDSAELEWVAEHSPSLVSCLPSPWSEELCSMVTHLWWPAQKAWRGCAAYRWTLSLSRRQVISFVPADALLIVMNVRVGAHSRSH